MSRRILRWLLFLLALGGLAISAVLSLMQAAPQVADVVCTPGTRFNCSEALASQWSRLAGRPVSFWGFLYFDLLVLWYGAIGLPNRRGRFWQLVPLLFTLGGVVFSMHLLRVMLLNLSTWCSWCLAAHAVNGLLLIGGVLVWPRRARSAIAPRADAAPPGDVSPVGYATAGESLPAAREEIRPAASRIGVLVATLMAVSPQAGMLYLMAHFQESAARLYQQHWLEATNNIEYCLWQHQKNKIHDIPIRADDPVIGEPDAAHAAVIFSDFQCPLCRRFDAFAAALALRFPDRVRFVFKHYPLSSRCNPRIAASIRGQHLHACDAALAAEAVRRAAGPATAVRYHARLFEPALQFSPQVYPTLAVEVGLDDAAFRDALNDPAARERIAEDVALAAKLGVIGSGTVFLDGRRLPAWQIVDENNPQLMNEKATWDLWWRLIGEGGGRQGGRQSD